MNLWAAAVAQYCAAFAEVREPLTEQQLRKVEDALNELRAEHYKTLAMAAEKLLRRQGSTR